MDKKIEAWKKKLAELLQEHDDIDENFTGKVEVNFNVGGITKIYANKEIK